MVIPASQAVAFLADKPEFNLRCQLIAKQFAINTVFGEGTGVANHTNRNAFAIKVVTGQVSPSFLAAIVLTDTQIQANAVADIANNAAAVPDTGNSPPSIDQRLQLKWDDVSNALALV